MVEPVTAVLTGIALVKKSVDFIKSNISTAQDIGDIIGHVDNALNGQQEVIKKREKKGADPFAIDNVAKEVIDAKLAQEHLYEMKQLINLRFGHGTWEYRVSSNIVCCSSYRYYYKVCISSPSRRR